MESVGNPKTWVPYMYIPKTVHKGFAACSPQWCRTAFPPPPSMDLAENGSKFSPLVITIISALAGCLILVSYFAIISKYCRNKRPDRGHYHDDEERQDAGISTFQEPLNYATVGGLDDSFIKSIPVRKYKKDESDGLVECVDCSVCLSEFHDDDRVRILPKCSHSFHIPCIDMWLKSHSTCPMCRASVTCISDGAQLHPTFTNLSSPPEIQSA